MNKPQLHQSMISMLYRCGEQFRRRYGAMFGHADKQEIIPPGVALIIGKATHRSIEKNLTNKIESGELLPIDQVKQIAHDEASGLWTKEVSLTDEEAENKKQVKGESIDISVTLSVLHALELAPSLNPKSIERKWVIELKGYPYDLAGTWDIEEPGRIRDTKTANKSPIVTAADNSEQMTMYSLAMTICDKKPFPALFLDYLVKTKTPKIVTLQSKRTEHQHNILLHRIERATEIIEKGAFTPADSSGPSGWVCTKKFCGYALSCPFWSGS